MKRKFILIIIFSLGLAVRLYRINAPLADWHSFRQADTASVSRELIKSNYQIFQPKYHDLSNIQSGYQNPQGYRMVEFPIYNSLHALTYQLTDGCLSFEAAGRLVSIIASLISAYLIYLIVKKKIDWLTGILAAGFFLFLPFSIFYSRTILPDSLMICFSLASIHFLTNPKTSMFNIQKIIGLVFGSLALLTKPYALFLLIPSYLVLEVRELKIKNFLRVAGYGLIAVAPLIIWRWWIQRFPEGIPVNQWLFNENKIRLRPAWWRWLFGDRLGKLILGYWGLIPFGIGLVSTIKNKINWLFYFWLGGILSYLVVFASGNVQHDYYQIIALPIISVFLAKGAYFLIHPPENINKYFSYLLLITSCLLLAGFSWFHVREFYKINHPEIVTAGKKADEILPQGAKVIAPYQGDTAFLYQINRRGWPAVTQSIEELIDFGAEYYVSVNYDQTTAELKEKCQIVEETDQWIIIDLSQCHQ